MGEGERIRDRATDPQHVSARQGPGRAELVAEGRRSTLSRAAGVQDGDDVRMLMPHLDRELELALETGDGGRIVAEQDLDGNEPIEGSMACAVDHAVRAAGDLLSSVIAGEQVIVGSWPGRRRRGRRPGPLGGTPRGRGIALIHVCPRSPSVVVAAMLATSGHNGRVSTLPVVLDVDTGIDDACALLLAALHPGLDLRGVTCVGGNAPLPDVVRNTLTVLEAAGRADVPVSAGARRPLLERPVDARHVHGSDGMGDLGMPPPRLALDPRHAVSLLRDLADEAADAGTALTLVPLAPMTNIALFARTHPDSFARLGRIVFMGGGAMVSNATAAAEFNVFHDPEATAMVLDACAEHDVPALMYGLDVFYDPTITATQGRELVALDTPVGRLAGGIIDFACRRFASDTATIGDAGAVATLLRPDAVRTQRLPVRVELSGTWTRGRTIVDLRDWAGDMDHDPHGLAEAVIDVALEIDGAAIADLWLQTMKGEL